MTGGALKVEHWGTFEVENFGDLLYPLVLAPHLEGSGFAVELVGPIGGVAPMGLERAVRRATRHGEPGFWSQAAQVDALILGGGDLVHAGEGLVSVDGRAERLDAWTFAVESCLLADVRPFAWNGVGVPFDIPEDLAPQLRHVCSKLDLITVRDEASRSRLAAAGVERDIGVVPDTGVLIGDVFTASDLAREQDAMRKRGLLPAGGSPLVVVHISFARPGMLIELGGALEEVRASHPNLDVALLEIGPTHGDGHGLRILADRLGSAAWLIERPSLAQVAAVLAGSDAIVSSSYHAALVGAALAVPTIAFFHDVHQPAKQSELARTLNREAWLLDRPSVVATALEAVLRGEGAQDEARAQMLIREARAHLRSLVDVVREAERPRCDLHERDAAHQHLLAHATQLRHRIRRDTEQITQLGEHVRSARHSARLWEAAYWRERDARPSAHAPGGGPRAAPAPLRLEPISACSLDDSPYRWGLVGPLFDSEDARALARDFPLDEAELRLGSDGRRSWHYRVRCLLPMGGSAPVRPHALSPLWRGLAEGLSGRDYRDAMTQLTGVDLAGLDVEANVFSYGRGAYQEPDPDLPEKVVTHVLWFNEQWDSSYGGCLRILQSDDIEDVAKELLPENGWSAVFVRSTASWHAVTPVTAEAPADRRALVVTFHRPGSTSSMWGDID